MKKIFSFILVGIALYAAQSVAKAQTQAPYTENNHIAYSKYPTGPVDGIYTIHLDTFVTGEKTVTTSSLPADVVLVLDVSGSMNDSYTSYSYTARGSQGYTYNNYPETPKWWQTDDGRYYYKHTDGNYYVVSRGGGRNNRNLSCSIGGTTYYLVGNSIQGAAPTGYSNNTTIWTGVLYTRQANTSTRLAALKVAVKDFIDVISESDPGEAGKHNQISIVKFASADYYDDETSYDATGNHKGANNNNNYNYTEIVTGFEEVYNETTANNLKTYIDALSQGGATASDYGMKKALALINSLYENGQPKRQSNKTVVFFTDGVPTHGTNYSKTVAEDAIEAAATIKSKIAYHDNEQNKDYNVTIYSVGVFGSMTGTGMTEAQRDTYMHRISSDYPNASGMDNDEAGTGGNDNAGYYQNASNTDLSSIFRSIASEAGGSQATTVTAEAATTVDVVSQSFDLPDGAGTEITVHFANCIGVDENGYLIFDEDNLLDNPDEGEEGHVSITIDEASQKVTASGFDYSGNWCGLDESLTTENKYRGMKLMLLIPIEMADDAVGGNAVGTNGPESGIYVDGVNVCPFEIPHIDLPTNLHIKKEDIADGECATFLIYRKPLSPATSSWETTPFKTVIVIGGNNDNTVKLMGLDPHYLYKIVEGGWSWSYELDHVEDFEGNTLTGDITSDKLITNPFIFVNSKKNTKVRHAESAVYNDFRTAGTVAGVDAVGETQKKQETSSESTETK